MSWRRYIVGEFPHGIASDSRYREISSAWQEFWKENGCLEFLRENDPPASTLRGVTAPARPGYLLEVKVVVAVEWLDQEYSNPHHLLFYHG